MDAALNGKVIIIKLYKCLLLFGWFWPLANCSKVGFIIYHPL